MTLAGLRTFALGRPVKTDWYDADIALSHGRAMQRLHGWRWRWVNLVVIIVEMSALGFALASPTLFSLLVTLPLTVAFTVFNAFAFYGHVLRYREATAMVARVTSGTYIGVGALDEREWAFLAMPSDDLTALAQAHHLDTQADAVTLAEALARIPDAQPVLMDEREFDTTDTDTNESHD